MNDTSELDALKARVKELEAAPAPGAGFGGVSGVAALASLVPRWLVVAGGVVFLAWAGLEIYINAQMQLLLLEKQRVDTAANTGAANHEALAPKVVTTPAPQRDYEACRAQLRAANPDISDRAINKGAEGDYACPNLPGYKKAAP